MTFKSTKYAKIMTGAKKHELFHNIRFPQLRLHCKCYKKKIAYRSECPEIIEKKSILISKGFYLHLFNILGRSKFPEIIGKNTF